MLFPIQERMDQTWHESDSQTLCGVVSRSDDGGQTKQSFDSNLCGSPEPINCPIQRDVLLHSKPSFDSVCSLLWGWLACGQKPRQELQSIPPGIFLRDSDQVGDITGDGYLHLFSECTGYFLLISCICIAIQALGEKGILGQNVVIETNLAVGTIKKNVLDDESNHRWNMSEHFDMECEMRRHCERYKLKLTFAHITTPPRSMSESVPLVTNPGTSVALFHQGKITHRFRTVLHDLPSSEIYKTYLGQKYSLMMVWERIDWITLDWALRKMGNVGPSVSKYLHCWLLMCLENARHGKYWHKTCPFCNEPEMTAHLFWCKESQQRQCIHDSLAGNATM